MTMENMLHDQDFTEAEVTLNIRRKLKNITCNVGFNTGGLLILLNLILGMYIGAYVITGNITSSIIRAKAEIHIFSSQIGGIAQAAELLVNICNKPEVAPFCKNDTIIY